MKTTTMKKKETNILVINVPVVPKGRTNQMFRTRTEQSRKRYNRKEGKRCDF